MKKTSDPKMSKKVKTEKAFKVPMKMDKEMASGHTKLSGSLTDECCSPQLMCQEDEDGMPGYETDKFSQKGMSTKKKK